MKLSIISECKTDEREGSHFPGNFNEIFVVNCLQWGKKNKQSILMQIVWFQKVFIIPPRKGSDLSGGGGQSANFFIGGGVHARDIFPMGSRGAYESNKEKTQKFTTTIYLRRYETRAINDLLETHIKVPRFMN